jgi:hypothetical protein
VRSGAPGAPAKRACLGLVGAAQAEIGIWGLLAPRSFFNGFPGAGHHWVSALGAYNEHLLRDYAADELGFAVLLLGALELVLVGLAMWPSRARPQVEKGMRDGTLAVR